MAPTPFCAFCIRKNPPNVDFYKQVIGSTAELRQSFQFMLGYDFHLTNFSICNPCWKLMQLVQDFRLRCFKANTLAGRIGQGLSEPDGWFSAKNSATIESIRMAVKDQMQQISRIEVGEEASKVTGDSRLSQDQMEVLESTVEIGEVKIESNDETEGATKSSGDEMTLSADIPSSTDTPAFKCNCCKKAFTRECNRDMHQEKCNKYKLHCKFCNEEQPDNRRLVEHYRQVHPGQRSHKCSQCDMRFESRLTLLQHERRKHTEAPAQHTCPECGKRFAEVRSLRAHIKYHSLKMPYQCETCEQRFVTNKACQEHVALVHSDEEKSLLQVNQRQRAMTKLKALLAKRGEKKASDSDSSLSNMG